MLMVDRANNEVSAAVAGFFWVFFVVVVVIVGSVGGGRGRVGNDLFDGGIDVVVQGCRG